MTNLSLETRKKLLKVAQETKRPLQEVLQYFVMERFLFRLSQSEYQKRFILKGGLLLHARELTSFRATQDIDLLGMTHNTPENIVSICENLCVFDFDDGVEFDSKTVAASVIRPTNDYQGVQVKFKGTIDRSKVHMRIDIGFADAVYPKPIPFVFPTILPLPAPKLLGYTFETVIAEKVEAMVQLGELNSRMKDFYDVWFLASRIPFELSKLSEAMKATFSRRKTSLPVNPVLFQPDFISSLLKQQQWLNFCKQNSFNMDYDFPTLVSKLGTFFKPIFEAMEVPKASISQWEPNEWIWQQTN